MTRCRRPLLQASRRALVVASLITATVGVSSSLILAEESAVVEQAPKHGPLLHAQRTSPPQPAPPAPVPPPERSSALPAQVQAIVDQTNWERGKIGLAPLTYHDRLGQAAAIHAADQRNQPCAVGYLSHVGSDGSRANSRIARTGLQYSTWGENIACGFSGVDAVMKGWMNSPGHRANILNSQFTHIGISIMKSDAGIYYWVQNFAVPTN